MPAYNNLSLLALMEGNIEEAIAHGETVLSFEPENVHALANLIRFCFLQGQPELAQAFGEQLKISQAPAWDLYTKKIEGLTYLGDREGILEIWAQVKAEKQDKSPFLSGLAFHWVAVAQARSGNLQQAKKLWKEALRRSPGLRLAKENLKDLLLPIGQRNGPWELEGHTWMSPLLQTGLMEILSSLDENSSPSILTKAVRKLLADFPGLKTWLEVMLSRGDRFGRDIAVELIKDVRSPELFEILKAFVLSSNGPDQLRHQTAHFLVKERVIPPGRTTLWFNGQQKEFGLLNFKIYEEPDFIHSDEIIELAEQALNFIKKQTKSAARQAESLLQQALKIEILPDLLNNLAVAYYFQDRKEEGMELRQQIIRDYPDYIPARTFVSHHYLLADEIQEAKEILLPILEFKRIHVDDFVHFVKAYSDLLVAEGEIEAAQSWLNTWESITPEHPDLKVWRKYVERMEKSNRANAKMESKRKLRGGTE